MGSEAEPTAAEHATHLDGRVRRDALLVLKKVGTEASLSIAVRALSDEELGNRDLAWQIVCRFPGAAQRHDVMEAAAAGLERNGEQAARWLVSIGPAAENAVVPFTRNPLAAVRRQAAIVLKAIGGGASLSPLERLFDDADAEVARAARRAHDAIAARQTAAD